jgi:hypothetical protein
MLLARPQKLGAIEAKAADFMEIIEYVRPR